MNPLPLSSMSFPGAFRLLLEALVTTVMLFAFRLVD